MQKNSPYCIHPSMSFPMAIVFIVSHFIRFEHHRPNKFSAVHLTTICCICYHIYKLCGYGGIGRRAGFRFQCLRRAGSSPVIRTTSEQASYRLLRLFYEKSELAHSAAPPLQIPTAPLGCDLVLGENQKDNSSKTRFSHIIASVISLAPTFN